jgi:Asp-tRNA(Asn)/Glu-tRNA(Gln) amidotransferase A subunit family amidase
VQHSAIRNGETRSLAAAEAHIARIKHFEEDLTAVCFRLIDEALDPYHSKMIVGKKPDAATA